MVGCCNPGVMHEWVERARVLQATLKESDRPVTTTLSDAGWTPEVLAARQELVIALLATHHQVTQEEAERIDRAWDGYDRALFTEFRRIMRRRVLEMFPDS